MEDEGCCRLRENESIPGPPPHTIRKNDTGETAYQNIRIFENPHAKEIQEHSKKRRAKEEVLKTTPPFRTQQNANKTTNPFSRNRHKAADIPHSKKRNERNSAS